MHASQPARSSKAGLLRGVSLALVMHALLIGALTWSTRWKSSTPASVEAELWSAVPQSAAPAPVKAAPPPPPPAPASAPTPKPDPAPKPAPEPKPAPKEEPKPDIAIAKQRELEKKQKLEAQVKREADDRQRLLNEKQLKERELKDKQAKELRAKAEQDKRQQTDDQQLKAALEKERIDKLARLTGGAQGRGAADANKGFSSGYDGRIAARIKPNITYGGETGAFKATVEIRLANDGTILSSRITKRSGNADWDTAVLRAIEKTAVVPKDTDGRVPPYLELVFDPRN